MKKNTMLIPSLLGVLASSESAKKGDTFLPNEQAVNSLFFSEGLTNYAVGYPEQADLERELDFLAPPVPTARRFEYKVADNATAFLAETDDSDIRAVDAAYKTVTSRGQIVQAKTYDKGLTRRLDVEDIAADPNAKFNAVAELRERLLRAEIYRAATMLEKIATALAKTWTPATGSTDPDMDLLATLNLASTKSGMYPNRVAFGTSAWIKRQLAIRAMQGAGGTQSVGLNESQLADFLGIDGAMRMRAMRTVSKTAKESLVSSDKVLVYMAKKATSKDDPSNIKRFVTNGASGMWTVYEQNVNATTVDITVSHKSHIAITCDLGIYAITVA